MNSNKIIKRLGLVLAIIMCLSFVACDFGDSGNDESNNVTDGNTTSAETTDAITDDSTESESVKADTDTETDMLPENSEETSEKKDETESAEAAETDETTDAEETTEAIKDTEEATETKFSFFDEDMYEYVSFERSDYIGLEAVISNDFRVDEDDVKAYVDSVIMENRIVLNYGATMTDKPIDIADSAFIYYTGYIDGEAFSGGSNMSEKAPYELIIGSGAFIPGFEDALVGMIPGETSKEEPAQITVTFPENYGNELAGKEAVFDIWVVYSIQYDLPEYNESFITEVLEFEAKGDDVIAEYEASVVKIIEDRIAEQKEEAIESAMWESLLDNFTVIKYPEVMVQEFYNSLISEIEYYRTLYGYYGYTFETLSDFAEWYLNLAEDADWEQEVLKMAQRKVSQYMIYHGIAQAEGFTVTEEEYAKELAYYIEYYKDYGYSDEELEAALGQDSIKESVLFEEVSNLIKANITVSYAE